MHETQQDQPARFGRAAEPMSPPRIGTTAMDDVTHVPRDLVHWGPIVAGLVTVVALLAVLSSLGLAVGLSAIDPGGAGASDISTGAWIWGIVSGVIAFFVGGMVAATSAAVAGRDVGLLNGLMVGAASIAATLLLIGFGAGALLGAGATALGDVVNIADQLNLGGAGETTNDAFDRVENSAWGSFIGLTLAICLAGLGGAAGARRGALDRRR